MDPIVTLRLILEACGNNDAEMATAACRDLANWLDPSATGGFCPEVCWDADTAPDARHYLIAGKDSVARRQCYNRNKL